MFLVLDIHSRKQKTPDITKKIKNSNLQSQCTDHMENNKPCKSNHTTNIWMNCRCKHLVLWALQLHCKSFEVSDFTLALTAGDVFVSVLCGSVSAADQINISHLWGFLSAADLIMLQLQIFPRPRPSTKQQHMQTLHNCLALPVIFIM